MSELLIGLGLGVALGVAVCMLTRAVRDFIPDVSKSKKVEKESKKWFEDEMRRQTDSHEAYRMKFDLSMAELESPTDSKDLH